MKKILFTLCLSILVSAGWTQPDKIVIESRPDGDRLLVNGNPFMINGMNWDYFPIGTNFNYSLWNQPDAVIQAALDEEIPLLKYMGVNVLRQYTGVPAKWITYIYEKYGIYTMLNHSFGRYGLTLDGVWAANTEYSDPRVRKLLLEEVTKLVADYRGTPGLLMYLLGNENNYGLFWDGAETEDIPVEDQRATKRARFMYELFNAAAVEMKKIDTSIPIAMCNGDLLFLDIIAETCKDVDIFGTNMYRGISFGDAFDRVKKEYGKPIMFTEFGADAFNAVANAEDQAAQATYMVGNWKEIYQNAAGLGKAGNSIGGFTFQFSDGWWKYGQTLNLDVHDTNASWSNGGYQSDYVAGENNMNEEWFGICGKGPTDTRGLYQLFPRAAYYALRDAHQLDVYAAGSTAAAIQQYFDQISITSAVLQARGDRAAQEGTQAAKIRLSRFSANLSTFNTGGSLISTPQQSDPAGNTYPSRVGFDHMQSFFIGVQANPAPNVRGNVELNVVGNVAENPIDQIFYENRARPLQVNTPNGKVRLQDINRVQVYRASFNWDHQYFKLDGFYRTGHYHWGYEGDFFGLYPEANYGPNIDIYNGEAPLGLEVAGKKSLEGLKLAFGPQLWWGANPALLLKYRKQFGKLDVAGIFHEDLEQQANTVSSFAIPMPKTRRATLHLKTSFGKLGVDLGGIWAGQPLEGRVYQVVRGDAANYKVFENAIDVDDTWGGKIKLTYTGGRFNWYGQAAAMGLVATGGGDYTQTFTGWRLKDSGSGNQYNFLSGFTFSVGKLQIAPNFLWQKPIEGPVPAYAPAPARPRNIVDDPFSVRSNREMVAGELLLTYDPTPGTWMYQWDNDVAEDAEFALSAGLVYRHMPTTMDAAIGIFPDGRTTFAFPAGAPAADLWEVHGRIVSKISKDWGIIANVYAGDVQANGSDARIVSRFGTDVRMIYKKWKLNPSVKVNDWGPYDYHRDFNLTFPLQLSLDIATSLGKPSWFNLPDTQLGVRGTWRSLDQYSPRYCPTTFLSPDGSTACDPTAVGYDNGQEWEIRTYVQINIAN